MTEEQKQIVLDKCATEEIRKDAELLFDVLDQAGIKYSPGELDLSAKVDEFNFEDYLPKEHAERYKTRIKEELTSKIRYDIWIPSKGWAFNVEPIGSLNIFKYKSAYYVDTYPVIRLHMISSTVDPVGIEYLLMEKFGYGDEFEKMINDFIESVVSEYLYPHDCRNNKPEHPFHFFAWPPIDSKKIGEFEQFDWHTMGLISGDAQSFYRALLGEETYRDLSKKRQDQYFATHPEWEQRFFEIYKEKLAQPTIDKNKVINAVNRGVDICKALSSAEKPIDERKAHKLALKAIREINPDFDRAGLYNDMSR